MNAVLIVGGGILQTYLIKEALGLGLRVLLTDQNHRCPGRALATQFWPISTADIQGHRRLGDTLRGDNPWGTLCGVVTAGADVAPSVSAAAEGAGVRGIPLETAQKTHNKFQVRRTLSQAQLNCYQPMVSHVDAPAFDKWVVRAIADDESKVWARIQEAYRIPLPWVVKPLEERASRGVSIVTNYSEYQRAIRKVDVFGAGFLVEERLVGTEHSAELIFGNAGEVVWFNIVDRYFDYSSGVPLELGHISPTRLDEHACGQILLLMLATAKAVGVNFGAWKCDILCADTGPKVLEATARLSGGYDAQGTAPLTSRYPMRVLLQVSCGLPVEKQIPMENVEGYAACAAIFCKKEGVIKCLPELCDIGMGHLSGKVSWHTKVGKQIAPAKHNGDRAGFFLYASRSKNTYDELWNTTKNVADILSESMDIE